MSVALHYRQAPEAEEAASQLAQQLAEGSNGQLRLQRGKMVVELLPAGSDKGGAIAALLDEPDFRGRTPIFVGDDVTDEAGFRSVNALGGVSIRVGDGPTEAASSAERCHELCAGGWPRRRTPDVRAAVHRLQSGHAPDGAPGGRRPGGRRAVVVTRQGRRLVRLERQSGGRRRRSASSSSSSAARSPMPCWT